MDSLSKYAGVSDAHLNSLDPELAEKLNIAFDSLVHDAQSLKESLSTLHREQESTTKQHKNELSELQLKCDEINQKYVDTNKLLTDADDRFRQAYSEKEDFRNRFDEIVAINSELNHAIRNIENEKEMLNDHLKNKMDILESYTTEINQLKEEARNVRQLKVETLIKLEDISAREASAKVQESRWTEELSSLRRHNEWLEDRLSQTSNELSTIRRDSCKKSHHLEGELSTRSIELENAKRSVEALEESVKRLTQTNEEHLKRIKFITDEQIKMEQLYTNEIEAQKQLIVLYKEQAKEVEEKNTELTEAATNMQSLLKAAYEKLTSVESEKAILKDKLTEEQTRLQSVTKNLTAELDQSHQLLDKLRIDSLSEEELRQLNPAVAATLTALKRGHSLTQLYADYVQVVEDRDQLKLDKQRLTEYVQQLVDDLKENAPALRNQQEDYLKMQSELKDLHSQYKTVFDKLGTTEMQFGECERRAGFYQREVLRLKRTCSDLSKQVKSLLYEVEFSRGTVITGKLETHDEVNTTQGSITSTYCPPIPDSSSMSAEQITDMLGGVTAAGSVIDKHLVTWSNIEELQSQNERLLCVARDLAGQLEKYEQNELETSKRVTDLSSRLATLSGELDVVRMSAREARTQASIASRQRDQYRTLLKRHDIEILTQDERIAKHDENSIDNSTSSDHSGLLMKVKSGSMGNLSIPPNTVDRLEESLNSLQNEFKRYREDKLASDSVYTSTIEQIRKDYSESRLLNQKLAAQLDFTHEKLRTLENNISGYKQEITILREMNARYSTSAAISEAELSRLRDELTQKTDRLTSVEVDARHFSRQLEALRSNESRLKQEIESLRRYEYHHSQLLQQLEAIQENIEHRESMDRNSMKHKVEQLEKQLAKAQSAIVDASRSSQTAHETLTHELMLARETASSFTSENERLLKRVNELEEKLKNVEQVDETSTKSEIPELSPAETLKRSQVKCRELEHEIECVKLSLEASRKQTAQMCQLAEQAEERLHELVDENKQLEKRMLDDLEEMKQRCEFLEAQLDLEKKERQNLVNENIRTTEEAHNLNANLHLELTKLQSELDSMKARHESALELESGAKARIEAFEHSTQEARDKYERELALHAQDVEALTEVRRELDSAKSTVNELQQEMQKFKSQANNALTDLQTETEVWTTERAELSRQLKQSNEEQSLLQDQIVKLTQQIISLRKLTDRTDYQPDKRDASDSESTIENESSALRADLQTSEELLQVISYLRRQKSIADAALDAASAEASRLLLRVTSLETQKEQLQNQLADERKANEQILEKSCKHSEVMERVEQLNLVTESNRLLRHEREVLREKLNDVENQLTKLVSEINPIKEENISLSAQKESLLCDKRSLQDERDRWKERCNRLVETAQRMDPEQYRLACNERDELQRKLIHAEEEVQHLSQKLSDLKSETDDELNKFNIMISESRAALVQAEQRVDELSVQENVLKKDLDTKETTIVKLREIGRKYRQESENLRRQISTSRSDEAQLQSTSEALIEARADLVASRSDLSALHTQYDRLNLVISEAVQLFGQLKSKESISPFVDACFEGLDDAVDNAQSNCQLLLNIVRHLLPTLGDELDQLKEQSDAQKERLLRTQLVESQLTKSQRDCAELRGRLADLKSVHSHVSTSTISSQTHDNSMITISSSELDASDSLCPSTSRPIAIANHSASVVTSTFPVSSDTPAPPTIESSNETVMSSSSSQLVPAWILRAAATVQPVQPTPTVTPPNSVLGPKQTAEIKPITNNIATVIPTPAPQIFSSNTTAGLSENLFTMATPSLSSDVSSGTNIPTLFQTNDQGAATSFRSGFSWRTNLLNQPTGSLLPSASSTGLFGTSSMTASCNSNINCGTKRRHEEVVHSNIVESTPQTVPLFDDNHVTTSIDSSRNSDSHSLPFGVVAGQNSGFSVSEAKRLRQALLSGPCSCSSTPQPTATPITLARSSFVVGQMTTPQVHSTTRLAVGQQEPGVTNWAAPMVTAGVAGIITASNFEMTDETTEPQVQSSTDDQVCRSTDNAVACPDLAIQNNSEVVCNVDTEHSPYTMRNEANEDIEISDNPSDVCLRQEMITSALDQNVVDTTLRHSEIVGVNDKEITSHTCTSNFVEQGKCLPSVSQYEMTGLDDDHNDINEDGTDSDDENDVEDNDSQVHVENEHDVYPECEYDDLEQDVSETETYSEDGNNNNEETEQEVIELSSGSAGDSNDDQDQYEFNQEGDLGNESPSDYIAPKEALSSENSPYFQNEELEETSIKLETETDDNHECLTTLPSSSENNDHLLDSVSTQEQTVTNSTETAATCSIASDVGRDLGIFSSLEGFVSTGSTVENRGLFCGFSSSPFTTTTHSFDTGSTPTTGLFKSFIPINPCTTSSVPSLFKPSAFSASLSAPKDMVSSSKDSVTRPKIQPIIWDSPASTSSQSYSENKVPLGAARRKKWGSMGNVSRVNRRPGPALNTGVRGGNAGSVRGGLPPRLG